MAIHGPTSTDCAAKRPRVDDTSSSLDADTGEVASDPRVSRLKRSKLDGTHEAPILIDESDSSDDEPLMSRLAARSLERPVYDANTNPHAALKLAHDVEKPAPHTPLAEPTIAQSSALATISPPHNNKPDFKEAKTPVLSSTKGSVYGKKTNLTLAFQSVSSAVNSSSRPKPIDINFLRHRKVLSPDQAFTDKGLKGEKKLVLSTDKSETGKNVAISGKFPVTKGVKIQENTMAGADSLDNVDIHTDHSIEEDEDDSDGTMAADSGNEYAASPAKRFRMLEMVSFFSLPFHGAANREMRSVRLSIRWMVGLKIVSKVQRQ